MLFPVPLAPTLALPRLAGEGQGGGAAFEVAHGVQKNVSI